MAVEGLQDRLMGLHGNVAIWRGSHGSMARMITSVAFILLAPATALPEDSAPAAPYSPHIVPASDEPALALQGIQAPGGLKVELFAAEPLLANPVALCIDEQGRIYVAESFRIKAGVLDTRGHMEWLDDDLAARTVEDRVAMFKKHLGDISKSFTAEHERVRRIEDTDGDGKADRATVFADGFNTIADGIGAGVLARHGNVWFSCIPRLWLLRDDDGDGRAESRTALHDGYGVHVGFYGHDLHGLRFGPDGKLYFSIGDRGFNVEVDGRRLFHPDAGAVLRCEPDGSGLEVFATGLRNPQELAFNEAGDLFTGDNNSDGGDKARWVHVVEGGDSGWRIGYQFIDGPVSRGPWNAEKLWHPRWDGQAAYIIPPIENIGDGPSGLAFYPGTGLPPRYDGTFFLCDFRGVSGLSGIRTFALERCGASYAITDEHPFLWSVLATDCDFGPDGAFYLTDWVTGWDKTGKGRIYKVSHPILAVGERAREVRDLLSGDMSVRTTVELAPLLEHPDLRVRQEAQFALAEKGVAAVPALFGVARSSQDGFARLHAVWALGQIARRDAAILPPVTALLEHADPEVRAQAARVLGDARAVEGRDGLLSLLRDAEPRVRFFAALSLGKVGQPSDISRLLEVLRDNADRDVYIRHAAVMGLTGIRDPDALLAAATDDSVAVRMGVLLTLRRLESPAVARFLEDPVERLVLEAARAINDVPIGRALPRLAAVPITAGMSDALGLRILNANYRLGTPGNAAVVASAAALSTLPEAIRIEALEELACWPRPSGRDRVMGLWRPLEPRPMEVPANALRPALASILGTAPTKVRVAAIQAAAKLSIREGGEALIELLRDGSQPGDVRTEALKALEALGDARLLDAARKAIAGEEPAVRIEGRRILARLRPEEATGALAAALERGSAVERQGAFSSLAALKEAKSVEILSKWMDRLIANDVPPEIQLDLLEAAAAKSESTELREKLARHEAARPADDPMSKYRECLQGGSAKLGRLVFYGKQQVSCQRCHKAEGPGGEVGPPLAGIGSRQKRDYILESLVAPNRQIAKGFDTVVLVTKEGKVYTGVLKDEDEESVRLTSPEGTLLAVPKDSVAERSGGVSAMPEDVSKFLSQREIRDLVQYLAELK